MSKSLNAGDGIKKTLEHVNEAERLAGVTQKAEEAEAARGRAEALRLADEAAERIREAERTVGNKRPSLK